MKAIKKVFGDAFKFLKVKSTKSTIGHSFGATAAEIIGIHLEGLFISKDKVGAQNPRFFEIPSINKVEHFQNIADNQIKIITIAPEVKGAEEGGLKILFFNRSYFG